MKAQALRQFRRKLKSQCTLGLWVTLESPSITEMGVALGVDWIVVDAEHGHLDWKDIVEHVRATVRSNTVVLVRVAELSASLIKRALDIGADGVVVPTIETADQLRDAIAFANYPPKGVRGLGAERATVWGQCFAEHAEEAGPNVLVVPLLETVTARENLDELIDVDGADVFLLGPADYSASAGFAGQWENPQVAAELAEIKERLCAADKACGIMSTSLDDLHRRRSEGFRMVGLGSDAGLLLRSLHGALDRVGRDCWPTTAMLPHNAKPLERPPERVRPDRGETIVGRVDGDAIEISPGVWFQGQCGKFNQARNLTTGLVRFEHGVRLPYHLHTFSESITLLKGSASVTVEGRRYQLQPLDNITLPSRLAHEVCNLSTTEPAMFHIAMNSDAPTRVLTDAWNDITTMPDDSIGVAGAEYVTRFATAARFQAGPNTEFIDYFNSQLMPGIQMSGGYGLFDPEGRLPAHFHDFDESICIIDGQAACIVEGREYTMGDYDTALQPRGRVHYFANRTNQQMAMIWVYAGPRPDRIVVDERCATVEGEPWLREPALAN